MYCVGLSMPVPSAVLLLLTEIIKTNSSRELIFVCAYNGKWENDIKMSKNPMAEFITRIIDFTLHYLPV